MVFPPKKVLVIEDDSDIRNSLRDILQLEEMDVVLATNGQEGLDQLSVHPDVRIVLLDMMMPIMDGSEFLRRIRSDDKWADIPVIAVSAGGLRASSIDAQAFMAKPFDLGALLDTIHRLCEPV
jgi:CheY-like chemotaxis protein